MATIKPTVTFVGNQDQSTLTASWTPITSADDCAAIQYPEYSVKSIQLIGTPDSSTTALHGSNDGTNYAALNVPAGTAIGLTSAGIKSVLENTRYVKPVVTGGGGSQSITIVMQLMRPNPMRT